MDMHTENVIMATGNNVRDQLGVSATIDVTAMRIRTADEPVTIRSLLGRLVDLDGTPAFTIEVPFIGETVREILDNDMGLQRNTRPLLNAAAEVAAAAHDATTRNLIEQILADEEQHLSWLDTEIDLYETLGESLYCASRLHAGKASAG
jgi:bacterioferritin